MEHDASKVSMWESDIQVFRLTSDITSYISIHIDNRSSFSCQRVTSAETRRHKQPVEPTFTPTCSSPHNAMSLGRGRKRERPDETHRHGEKVQTPQREASTRCRVQNDNLPAVT